MGVIVPTVEPPGQYFFSGQLLHAVYAVKS